jgi:LPS export ABC transporter protein LptC
VSQLSAPTLIGAALAVGLAGCVSSPREPAAPEPFVFRSLDLRQQNGTGEPAWDLTSPEARYDLIRQLAQARRPQGTIYRNGKPHITIKALRGTVIGDGQAIQLEGEVLITLLGRNPVRISGDQARWIPRDDLMVIDRRPVATDQRTRISAQNARYLLAMDRVELRGSPVLEQWPKAVPAVADRLPAPIRVQASSVDWRPEQGSLLAPGAVQGERHTRTEQGREAGGQSSTDAGSDLLLTASGLRGNLREGFLDLLAPVRLRERGGRSWLQAGQTRWAFNAQLLASERPFEGLINNLNVRGDSLRIDLDRETVLVPRGCRLNQPGQQLSAERCLWHWDTERFLATGAVELRRSAYRQITRSSQLSGRIGREGTVEFASPGARVNSQFSLPAKDSSGPQEQRRRAPVQF